MSKTKISKPITKEMQVVNNQRRGDFDMVFAYKERPVSAAFIEALAHKLLNWSKNNNDALKISVFLEENDICLASWYHWLKIHPVLKHAYDHALMCVGNHREMLGLRRKLDSAMVMKTMPNYDKEWRDLNEWYAKIKEDSASQGTNITVRMDAIPSIEERKS